MKTFDFILIFVWVLLVLGQFDNLPGVNPIMPVDPFPGEGKRLLIVYQTEQAMSNAPPSQSIIMLSTRLRKWLDGNAIEYRFLDADVTIQTGDKKWSEALSIPRQSYPWVMYSNGVTGFSKPLQSSIEELKSDIVGVK